MTDGGQPNTDPVHALASDRAGDTDTQPISTMPRHSHFEAVSDVPDPLIGHTFGGYTLVKRLGQGGGGVVYLADQPGMFRQVALKMFALSATYDDPALLIRFQREVQAIAMVEHVHILPVYEWGEADGYIYFSMRLAEQSLAHALTTSVLTLPEIARMLDQIAAALDYAHSHGVIHRDLKPANILLDSQGNCLLADFGIAHILSSATITPDDKIMGTPLYMSPEQASPGLISAQSDIYSLGVILFELVCGRVPFQGTIPQVLTQHVNIPPPQPSELNPRVPKTVSAVILKALSKAPDARYPTATAFAIAFRDVLTKADAIFEPDATATVVDLSIQPVKNRGVSSVSVAAFRRAAQKLTRPQQVAVLGVLVLLMLGGFILFSSIPRPDASQDNQHGLQALQKLDYQTAINQFQAAIQVNPNMADAYFNLGVSYEERADLTQNDLAAALTAYRTALKQDNRLLLARYRLAEMLLDQQQTDEAFTIIDTGVRILTLGNLTLDDQNRYDLSFLLYTTRARAYWLRGDASSFNLALNDITTALSFAAMRQFNRGNMLYTAEAYYIQARIYTAQGRSAEAKQAWLDMLANSDPQNARQRLWADEARQALNAAKQ